MIKLDKKTIEQYNLALEDNMLMSDDWIVEYNDGLKLTEELLAWFVERTPKKHLVKLKTGNKPLWIHLQTKTKKEVSKLNLLAEKDIYNPNKIHVLTDDRPNRLIKSEDILDHIKQANQVDQFNFRFQTFSSNSIAIWGRPYRNSGKLQLVTIYPLKEDVGIPLTEALEKANVTLIKSDYITVNEFARK
jgi:hypothetical protein